MILSIGTLLERARTLVSKAGATKDDALAVIKQECGIDVLRTSIEIKGGIIAIKAHPAIKSIIYTKKSAIIARLREGGMKIADIR
jgi:hypothetical protein